MAPARVATDDEAGAGKGDEPFVAVKYVRRHFVLASYALSMFGWNLSSARAISIVPSYAQYHNTSNELRGPPEFGIDSWTVIDNFVLLFTYILGAYAVDRWGLKVMILGSFSIALSNWIWYAAGTSMVLVLISRTIASLFGPMVSSALLAISNRWYPPEERAKATALGSLVNVLGVGAALVVSPMFATADNEVLDLTLKSCDVEDLEPFMVTAFQEAAENGTLADCVGDIRLAKDSFCCYLPVDIEFLNLAMAVLPTLIFIFTAVSVRDLPPTPPSRSAGEKDFVGLIKGLKMMFSNQRFAKLALSDFVVSGPPLVLTATLSRIFPAEISEYNYLASIAGVGLAIPVAIIVAHYLDKTRAYWTFTMAGYAIGTVFWLFATVAFASGTMAGAWVFLGMVILAVGAYVAWQTAVYECKLEYVFSHHTNLEGYIVGADRIVINLSSLVFIAAIPPERVGGALNTFWIGAAVMVIGCLPTALIRDRYKYMRQEYDAANASLDDATSLAAKDVPL